MERLKYNRKILEELKEYVEFYPDLRFGQILRNFDVVEEVNISDNKYHEELYWTDDFNTESRTIWKRMNERVSNTTISQK